MVVILGSMALSVAVTIWAVRRAPLMRAIGLSFACFAEASRGERDALR